METQVTSQSCNLIQKVEENEPYQYKPSPLEVSITPEPNFVKTLQISNLPPKHEPTVLKILPGSNVSPIKETPIFQKISNKGFKKEARGNLPKSAIEIFKKWLYAHFDHPYPNDAEKEELMKQTELSMTQVNNWFINARRRIWKPAHEKDDLSSLKKQNQTRFQNIHKRKSAQEDEEDVDFENYYKRKQPKREMKIKNEEKVSPEDAELILNFITCVSKQQETTEEQQQQEFKQLSTKAKMLKEEVASLEKRRFELSADIENLTKIWNESEHENFEKSSNIEHTIETPDCK